MSNFDLSNISPNNFLFTSISRDVAVLPASIAPRPSNAQEVQGEQQTPVATSEHLTFMEVINKIIADGTLSARSMPANNRMIKGYICHPKLKGTDPKKIAENNSRPEWDLTSSFHSSYNHALIISLLSYLQGQGNILTSDVSMLKMTDIVKKHFSNQQKESRKSEEEGNKKRQKSRRYQRTGVLVAHQKARSCYQHFAFQKGVVSKGDSDNKDNLTVFRPSWRSYELQKLFEAVDLLSGNNLGDKSKLVTKQTQVDMEIDLPSMSTIPLAE
ncbi:hypothetical protein J3Q64DRAFT_1698051 [Phycomyces blakesleeanus]|uniref:Uncharacterized protein n=1 Tax=Phycomyces blakesleeanus TaxID=4837 RepID=A0ABR3B506_PHYBL